MTYEAPERVERPPAIVGIALWQLVKGALLFGVACITLTNPNLKWGTIGFWELFYIASNGGGRPGLFTFVGSIYAIVVGIGLWHLRNWARRVLMLTSGIVGLMWIKYMALDYVIRASIPSRHGPTLHPGFEQQSVYMLAATDVVVFLLLAFQSGISEAFSDSH
jgi:hypothetical protein